jgi:phenazine biosynthesis protein phzE
VCGLLGLPLARLPRPDQGRRRRVRVHGRERWLGFYNSFAARADGRAVRAGDRPVHVEVDPDGSVLALRAPGLSTAQFHAESFLTGDSPAILRTMLRDALAHDTATDALFTRGEHVHEHA